MACDYVNNLLVLGIELYLKLPTYDWNQIVNIYSTKKKYCQTLTNRRKRKSVDRVYGLVCEDSLALTADAIECRFWHKSKVIFRTLSDASKSLPAFSLVCTLAVIAYMFSEMCGWSTEDILNFLKCCQAII